ncbi:hypothetical protein FHW92_000875 [Novosphingobium sp. SG707]|nr:hypothetical protein [Novosphingobium sp. SG707]
MMYEFQLIQSTGFRNHGPQGARDGFELRLRLPNYRGMRLSLLDGIDVTVDGEFFGHEVNSLILHGKTYDLEDMRKATAVSWAMGDFGSVFVPKAGGLAPGIHHLKVAARVRSPYFPPHLQPLPVNGERLATIILP